MDRKKIVFIFSILLLSILGIFLVFSFSGEKLETAQFDSIKMSYYDNTEIVLDKNKNSVDYYFEVLSDKDDSLYNISLVKENNTNTSEEKIKISLIKNGEYIVGDENSGESISSSKLSELLSNQSTNVNNKDIYVLKIWAEEEVIDGNFKVSVKVEEVKKTDDKSVRVKLDADGGKLSVSEVSVEKDGTYGALPTPVKDGYNFIGWYSKKENGKLIAKETKYSSVRADILYALYIEKVVIKPNIDITNKVETPNTQPSNDNTTLPPAVVVAKKEYTITFITNGGSEIKPITLLEGTKIENVNNPIREGYDFVGWDVVLPDVMPSNNLVLNALWKAKTYNVNLKFSEKLNVKKSVVYDSTYGTLPDVSKDGYTFIGWFTSDVDGEQVKGEDIVKITSDITLYARLEANKYNIKFSSDTNDVIEDIEVTYDQMYGELPVVSKNGYSFDGWYLDREYKEKVNSTDIVKITSDIILFARFVANRYTITFDFGYDMLNKDIYYGEQYGELPVASKDGYDFVGWFTAGADGVQITSDSVYEFATNQILYARYEAKKLNVSFETFGGSSHEKIQVTYDEIYGELPTPEKTGYDFGGWYFDNEFKNVASGLDTVKILEDITLYAKFTANTYTLTMDFNFDVGATMNKDITYDQAYGELVQPDRYGYTFMGWYTAQNGGELITAETVVKVTSNLTIYARWNRSGVLKLTGNTKQSRLPLEYQELEYIESTGTQYIDTGVIPDENTGFEIEFITKNNVDHDVYGSVFGARTASKTDELQLTSYIPSVGDYNGTVRFNNLEYNAGILPLKVNKVSLKNKVYNDGVNELNLEGEFTAPCSLTVFALNEMNNVVQYGNLILYNFKLYDGDTIIRDYVPVYRTTDSEIGLYDLVNGKFYPNLGEGEFKVGYMLPDEYQQVEYIESSGTQYIELDYIASNITNSVGTFQITNNSIARMLFGSRTSASSNAYTFNWGGNSQPYRFYNTFYMGTTASGLTNKEIDIRKHTFLKKGADLFIDDVFISSRTAYESTIFTTPHKMIVFGCNSNGTIGLFAEAKIFDLKFYDNDVLKVDLVPAYRIVDNEVGMYDLVSGKFYTNSGTGEFDKGNVVVNDNDFQHSTYITSVGDKTKNLFDKNDYVLKNEGILHFSTKDLVLGKTYTLSSDLPITWFKISNSSSGYNSIQYTSFDTGFYKYTFTMRKHDDIPFSDDQYIMLGIKDTSFVNDINLLNNYKIQIEEGSVSTDYVPYGYKIPFEVVKSDDPSSKFDVIKQSKNLFDESKYDQVSEYKTIGNNTYTYAEILLKPNTTYRVSVKRYNGHTGDKYGYLLLSDHSGINGNTWTSIEHLTAPNNSNVNYIYTTGDSGKLYIGYNVGYGYTDSVLSKIWNNTDVQIEEGTQATEYEPYYKYVNEIYLKEPLRCVDGVCDYIDFETKKVVRKIGKWVFDGDTTWRNADNGLTNTYRGSAPINAAQSSEIISNRFTVITSGTSTNDTENVQISGNYIYFRVFRDRLVSNNLDGFKTFMSTHPTEVLYQLSEEYTEDVIIPDIPFGNGYVVNFGTKVKPSIE